MSETVRGVLKASAVLLIFPARAAMWVGVWMLIAGTPEWKLYGAGLTVLGIGGYALLIWAITSLNPLGRAPRGMLKPINWRGMPTAFERTWLDVYGKATVARPKPR